MRGARHRRTATLIFLSSLRAVNYLRPNEPCALIERCAGSEFPKTFWSGRGRKSSAIGWCLLPWRPRSWNAGATCMADPKATRGECDRGAARPERSESTAREKSFSERLLHQLGIILVMSQRAPARPQESPIARTIRIPAALRRKIAADAERCGRSFEGQGIALLRRTSGEG